MALFSYWARQLMVRRSSQSRRREWPRSKGSRRRAMKLFKKDYEYEYLDECRIHWARLGWERIQNPESRIQNPESRVQSPERKGREDKRLKYRVIVLAKLSGGHRYVLQRNHPIQFGEEAILLHSDEDCRRWTSMDFSQLFNSLSSSAQPSPARARARIVFETNVKKATARLHLCLCWRSASTML
ncbi:hypothetical protein THAR02_11404 [Trichoderma harzianum]|uniref:Uncharacterized protein n=1 Tax=Trichoderma harzianum TaxID=5544 RepID=A0A0F9Z792_TRIHA|nr:hypothetical protein THAR02_11404 [Trichoderma harzianum]